MVQELFSFSWLDRGVEELLEFFGVEVGGRAGGSLHFFIYDVIKILILLSTMIFIISYIRSYFSVEKTKRTLEKMGGLKAHIAASLLGTVTPFCSCSSVPLFIGFIEGGIPLGVTFSFLITSPIVNEAALVILLGTFGPRIAAYYVVSGILLGVAGGYLIHILKLERYVEEYVYKVKLGEGQVEVLSRRERFNFARENVRDIVGRIWKYLFIGIGIGALIHGWAPEEVLSKYAGPENPLAVLFATIVAIPLYSNAMGTIPIAEALINKGVGMGTAMAFMMATTALSLPEMILLRKVIKPGLIGVFTGITGVGIIVIGYIFNIII